MVARGTLQREGRWDRRGEGGRASVMALLLCGSGIITNVQKTRLMALKDMVPGVLFFVTAKRGCLMDACDA